jgi:hypothetical protein
MLVARRRGSAPPRSILGIHAVAAETNSLAGDSRCAATVTAAPEGLRRAVVVVEDLAEAHAADDDGDQQEDRGDEGLAHRQLQLPTAASYARTNGTGRG